MQGAAQKGGRHIGKSKKWLYVTVVFSREKPLKWQFFLEFSIRHTIFVHFYVLQFLEGEGRHLARELWRSKDLKTTQQERIMLNISYLIIGIIFRAVPEK